MRYYQLSYAGISVTFYHFTFNKLKMKFAWRRPALTKGNPSLQSALRSLTSVFGMGTGVSFLLSPPHYFIWLSKRCSLKTGFEESFQKIKQRIILFG